MGMKELEHFVEKLYSMHLAVPGAVAHIYHIQRTLPQVGMDRAWLSPAFHSNIIDWKILGDQTADQPTHLDDIVRRKPTHLGFCNDSELRAGGVCLDPSRSGKDLIWRHPWLADIIDNFISSTNREGTIANSDLELSALILHEATLIAAGPDARLAAPCSGSDNTWTIFWSTKEASTINPVGADLI